jgi:hypothetical protein
MKLFYSHNGVKLLKRAKNNCLLLLVYFWYFFWFILKQIRVFLKGFWLKTIKSKIKRWTDSPGPPVSPPRWLDRTGSARLSPPPHSLSLGRNPNPTLSGDSHRRRAPRPASVRFVAALWRFRFASLRSTFWPWGFVIPASNRRRAPPLWILP